MTARFTRNQQRRAVIDRACKPRHLEERRHTRQRTFHAYRAGGAVNDGGNGQFPSNGGQFGTGISGAG